MKITHIRVSVLESGPGYNNSSCTLEAQVEDGEEWTEVANELRAMCKSHIKGSNEIDRLWQDVQKTRDRLADNQAHIKRQEAEIKANREIIRSHEKLGQIATREGIPNPLDDIPF